MKSAAKLGKLSRPDDFELLTRAVRAELAKGHPEETAVRVVIDLAAHRRQAVHALAEIRIERRQSAEMREHAQH